VDRLDRQVGPAIAVLLRAGGLHPAGGRIEFDPLAACPIDRHGLQQPLALGAADLEAEPFGVAAPPRLDKTLMSSAHLLTRS
jgi:hypothetical protein